MKLTIELDPSADRALFDRVMAAVMDHPAPVTMESAPEPTPFVASADASRSESTAEDASDAPRIYGEPGPGRKRRSKEEVAEDKRIEELSESTGIAINMDVPASELIADMEAAAAENEPTTPPEEEEESFDLEEEITLDAFRAEVLKANKAHGSNAVEILKEYGSGIKQIPADKYREVLDRLKGLDDA